MIVVSGKPMIVVSGKPMISLSGKPMTVNSIFLISGTVTLSHSKGKKMKHRYQSFTRIGRQFQSLERQVYADWTSVSSIGFIPLLSYTDEYNDDYLCRDFFVGFNFWLRLSFQMSEFRVHWPMITTSFRSF